MTGALDGGLQQTFGAAFAEIMLDGRHYHKDQQFAANGDVTRTVIKAQSIKGQRDTSADRRRPEGFTDKDARLIVLQTYEGRAITPPVEGDEINLDSVLWTCGQIGEDAAHTHFLINVTRA